MESEVIVFCRGLPCNVRFLHDCRGLVKPSWTGHVNITKNLSREMTPSLTVVDLCGLMLQCGTAHIAGTCIVLLFK